MPNITKFITLCKTWPADMEKIKELIKECPDLNSPIKYERDEYYNPLLAVIIRYPSLPVDLNKEYKSIEYYDLTHETQFFENHHISNEYLLEIIKLFLDNGYDIHAGEGTRAAILLATLYHWARYTDSYIFEAARMIIKEEPRSLDIIRKHNIYNSDDDDDDYIDLEEELYEACTLYGRICWDEADCIVPDHMYPELHKITTWRKLLEACFEGNDPTDIGYYDKLYGQKIVDIIIPEYCPDTRPGREEQYSIDEKIILVCEKDVAVIDKWGALYIDNSEKNKKNSHKEIPSPLKSIIGQTILSVESQQLDAHSEKYKLSYAGFELVINLSNDMNMIITDGITAEERAAVENETDDEEKYKNIMQDLWNTRIFVNPDITNGE